MLLPQPCPASEVHSCSPFPEEQAVGVHRPESPVTAPSQSLQTGCSTIPCKFWSRAGVLQLLEIYGQKGESFKDPQKNKIIQDEKAGIMNSKGFNECETKACETKFKNLTSSNHRSISAFEFSQLQISFCVVKLDFKIMEEIMN